MRRLFLLVSAVVLVDTMFFAAVAPLLPHFSDELGLSKTAAGVLTAAYPAGTFAGALPAGWLAARWGVKPTLLLGLALLGVTSLVFAFANHIVLLDAARFVQGIGGACMWAAGMAWLVSAAPAERRGELIGSALAAAIVGVLFGPVLGGAATVVGHGGRVQRRLGRAPSAWRVWAWTTPGRAARAEPGRAGDAARAAPAATCWPASGCSSLPAAVRGRARGAGAAAARRPRARAAPPSARSSWSPRASRRAQPRWRAGCRTGTAGSRRSASAWSGALVMAVLLPLPETWSCSAAALVLAVSRAGRVLGARAWRCCPTRRSEPGSTRRSRSRSRTWPGRSATCWAAARAARSPTRPRTRSSTALLGAACAVTLAGVLALGRGARARSPAAR